jgi:hypothetical protein
MELFRVAFLLDLEGPHVEVQTDLLLGPYHLRVTPDVDPTHHVILQEHFRYGHVQRYLGLLRMRAKLKNLLLVHLGVVVLVDLLVHDRLLNDR